VITTRSALAIAVAATGLAACGGSSSPSSSSAPAGSAPAQTSTTSPGTAGPTASASNIAADPSGQLRYTKSSLTAKSGEVTFRFANTSPVAHNLSIQQGSSGAVLGATPTFQGGVRTLSVNLKPGTYTFFCSVPGHREAGMQGTLTVS
jgi:plastocyanin